MKKLLYAALALLTLVCVVAAVALVGGAEDAVVVLADADFNGQTADPDTALRGTYDGVRLNPGASGKFTFVQNPADPEDVLLRVDHTYTSANPNNCRLFLDIKDAKSSVYTISFAVAAESGTNVPTTTLTPGNTANSAGVNDGFFWQLVKISNEGIVCASGNEYLAPLTDSFTYVSVVCDTETGMCDFYINGCLVYSRQFNVTDATGKELLWGIVHIRMENGGNSNSALYFDDVYYCEGEVLPDVGYIDYNLGANAAALPFGVKPYGTAGEAMSLPTPTWEGVDFLGWFSDAGLTEPVSQVTPGADPISVYAKWSQTPITYELNGRGALPAFGYDTFYAPGMETLTLPVVTDTSTYAFMGWCTDPSCEGEVYTDSYPTSAGTSENMVFYAKWVSRFVADMSSSKPFPEWVDDSAGKLGIHFSADAGALLIDKQVVTGEGEKDGQLQISSLSAASPGNNGIITLEISLSAVDGQDVCALNVETRHASTVCQVLSVENETGNLYAGGVKIGKLDSGETLVTLVLDLVNSTMDVYVDGSQYLSDHAYNNITPADQFEKIRLYFPSSGYGQLRINRFAFSETEHFTYTDLTGERMYQVTLTDSTYSHVNWEASPYTLPEGLWISGENVVSGSVDLTAGTAFRKVDVALLPGASVRTAAPAGLRFESTMDRAVYDALTDAGYSVAFGTWIFPAASFDGIPENAVCSRFEDVNGLAEKDGVYTYYTSLVNLLGQNYARAFGAVSYITVSLGEEEVYSFTTAFHEANNARSVYQVACAVAQSGELSGMEGGAASVVTGYLDGVVEIKDDSAVQIANYTSPYMVTISDGVLKISGGDPSVISNILYGGRIYTGGWTVEEGVLTAPLPAQS